jgi:hypothetical protein
LTVDKDSASVTAIVVLPFLVKADVESARQHLHRAKRTGSDVTLLQA